MRCKRMPKRMAGRRLRHTRRQHCVVKRPLNDGLVQMISAALAGDPIDVPARGREKPIASPMTGWRLGTLPTANPDLVVLAGSRGTSRLATTESDAVCESAGSVTNRRPMTFSTSCPRQPDGKMKCQVNVTRLECASIASLPRCSYHGNTKV
jgi:hypothetical protein